MADARTADSGNGKPASREALIQAMMGQGAASQINQLAIAAYEAGRNDPLTGSFDEFLRTNKLQRNDPRAKALEDFYYGAALLQAEADFTIAKKDPNADQNVMEEGVELFEEKYDDWNKDEIKNKVRPLTKTSPLLPYDQARKDAYWNKYKDEIAWRVVNPFE